MTASVSNLLPDDDSRLKSLCKLGEGAQCCRWLARDRRGFFCAKLDLVWAPVIYKRHESGEMGAKGDNCPGLESAPVPPAVAEAITLVKERFPQAIADHDQYGCYVRAITAEGRLYGFLGRAPTIPEAWIEAARLLKEFSGELAPQEAAHAGRPWTRFGRRNIT